MSALIGRLQKGAGYIGAVALIATVSWSFAQDDQKRDVDLSPKSWGEGEADRWVNIDNDIAKWKTLQPTVTTGEHGAIAGTTGPAAVHAGLTALKKGGSAIDAAVTTALTQITLAAGSWVSFAGITDIVYYEAKTGKVYEINACFGVPLYEDDPGTIPTSPTPSGRTALVPGFFAGMEAAHNRFGKLQYATLFEPALYYAENGFEVDWMLNSILQSKKDVLARLPKTKEVFFKEDGELYSTGDVFKQPKLAKTLRNVAQKGSKAYIYNGEWAEQFVAAVRAEGGKITMEDMRRYKVHWGEPLHTTFAGYDVYTTDLPNYGGPMLALGLNLIEEAELLNRPHYTKSVASLKDWIKIDQGTSMGMYPYYLENPETYMDSIGLKNFDPEHLADRAFAKNMWELFQNGTFPLPQGGAPGSHSDAIAVVDKEGNIAVLTHTINTTSWGSTGINVGGISIPDSANFQQMAMKVAGPGNLLPSPLNPVIVMKNGKPYTFGSSIGAGLSSKTLSYLVNVLGYDMNPREAIGTPALEYGSNVSKTLFSAEFSDEIDMVPDTFSMRGHYVGILYNADTSKWEAAAGTDLPGYSAAY